MAYNQLRKSDLARMCRERGLSVGRLPKERLIAQLVENDQSEEQAPDPRGAPGVPGEPGRSHGGSLCSDREGVRPDSPVSTGRPQSSSSLEELRKLELELKAKELALEERRLVDREREREDRVEQRKHELAMEERRAKRACRGVSGEGPRDTSGVGTLDSKLLPQFKEGGILMPLSQPLRRLVI